MARRYRAVLLRIVAFMSMAWLGTRHVAALKAASTMAVHRIASEENAPAAQSHEPKGWRQ